MAFTNSRFFDFEFNEFTKLPFKIVGTTAFIVGTLTILTQAVLAKFTVEDCWALTFFSLISSLAIFAFFILTEITFMS